MNAWELAPLADDTTGPDPVGGDTPEWAKAPVAAAEPEWKKAPVAAAEPEWKKAPVAAPPGAAYLKAKAAPTQSTIAMPGAKSAQAPGDIVSDIKDWFVQKAKEQAASPEQQKYGPVLGPTIQAGKAYFGAVPRMGQRILKSVAGGVEALTGTPLDNDTLLGRATSPEALAYTEAESPVGKAASAGGDFALTALEGAALPLPAAASYFGGTQGLGGYDTAIRAGVAPEQASNYAFAQGAIGAGTAMLPAGKVFEGSLGTVGAALTPLSKQTAGRILGPVAEAEALNVLNNMSNRIIDPNQNIWDQSGFLPMLGQVAGMKLITGVRQDQNAPKPPTVSDLLEGRLAMLGKPQPIEVGTGPAESQRSRVTGRAPFQMKGGAGADDLIANQVLKAINEIPPEVAKELRDHYAAQDALAGLGGKVAAAREPAPLSPEAQKYQPLLDSMNKAFYDSYAALAQARGETPAEFNQYHITRPVIEGRETGPIAGTSILKKTSGSQNAREVYAFREIGNPKGEVRVGAEDGTTVNLTRDPQTGNYFDPYGREFAKTEATPSEIEARTGLRYAENPFVSILNAHRDTNRALRSTDLRRALSNSDLTAPEGEGAPKGWEPLPKNLLEAFPEFEGKVVSPLMQNYLSETVNPRKMGAIEKTWDSARRLLTGSIFANPTAHAPNQFTHFLAAYGLKETPRMYGDIVWAKKVIEDAHNGRVDPALQKYLEGGASLMSSPEGMDKGNTRIALGEALGKQEGQLPTGYSSRETNTLEPINRMNKQYTWKVDDVLRLALARKVQRATPDATPRQVMDEVSSYFPDYQKSEMEPMGAMVHSPLAKNTLMFNTYGAQAIEATKNLGKNLGKNLLKNPKKGVDELGGLGLAALGAGAATKAYRGFTQDDETEVRPGGTLHILDKLWHANPLRGGPGNTAKELSTLVHFNPIVKGAISAGFQLVDPKIGQKIGENGLDAALYRRYLKDGDYGSALKVYEKMSKDYGETAAAAMLPFGKEVKALNKGETLPDTAIKMLMAGRRVKDDANGILLDSVLSQSYSPYPTSYGNAERLKAKIEVNKLVQAKDPDGILDMAAKGFLSPAQTRAALMRIDDSKENKTMLLVKKADPMAVALAWREMDPQLQNKMKPFVQQRIGAAMSRAKTSEDRDKLREAARLIGLEVPVENQ